MRPPRPVALLLAAVLVPGCSSPAQPAAPKHPVTQYAVDNGGHVVPNKVFEAPSMLGPTTHDLDAPPVIWDFFMKNGN